MLFCQTFALSEAAHCADGDITVLRTALQLVPQAEAMLTAGDPVKNARALLRYALPIENKSVRTIQVIQ